MPTVTARPTVAVVIADAGTVDWNNVNYVLLQDGTNFATAAGSPPHLSSITSKAIKATGFNDLSVINDNDVINSISVILDRKADFPFVVLTRVYLVENGVITGVFTELPQYWTETLTEETFTSLNGLTSSLPSAAILKSSTSGLAVSCDYYDADGATITASIDDIRFAVDYGDAVVSLSPTEFAAMPPNNGLLAMPLNKSHLIMPNNKGHLTIPGER